MKYIKSLLAVLVIVTASGCEKMLDLTPEDTINPGNYFSNAKELQLWTNQFYLMLDGADAAEGQNADDNVDNSLGEVMSGQRDAASENGWSFSNLRKINYYLQNSHNTSDAAARKQYDGVAYFFRAYFYANKVREYGDVPWYNQVLGSADDELLFKPRDSRELVMDSVMADLDKAINMLPTAKSKATVTKWTALALKSRVGLYEGTFRKYHGMPNADKFLQASAAASQEFIQSSGYTLYTSGTEPYRALFNSIDAQTSEVVLAKVHSAAANLMHGVQFNIINSRQGLTKRFMNHYLMANGTRYTAQTGWETKLFAEETQNRDPRMKQTVLTPGYIQKGATVTTLNKLVAVTGYQPIKFVAEAAYDGATKSITDWPLFRAAEVFLNHAEARAELGTLSQSDLDNTINKIRTRAGMPALNMAQANANTDPLLLSYYPNVTRSANTGVILEIRRERTVELVLEGFRQWDLFRWKEGKALTGPYLGAYFPGPGRYDMNNDGTNDLVLWTGSRETIAGGTSKQIGVEVILSNGNSGYIVAYPTITTVWNENRDYLWPIPTSERVITGGKLTQNPGWTDSSGY